MQQEQIIRLMGGLDLITPAIEKQPGFCIAAENYESNVRGYGRMAGYERFDGQPEPHLASYWLLDFDSGSTQITEGDTVEGDTSGATGIALYDVTAETGTYGGGDATGTIILYNVSGTFQDDEGLEVSAANVATADGAAVSRGSDDGDDDLTYLFAAVEKRRDVIAAPPGSGGTLGLVTFNGDAYCWRNNAGGTAAVMFKKTASGWSAQSFGTLLNFTSGGTTEIAEGDTITGDTSTETATVERVVLHSGTWAGGDAVGYLVLSSQSGAFQAEGIEVSAVNVATIAGNSTAIALPPDGTYRAIEQNFYGTAALNRLYFVNGEGYAHEWDGAVLTPIILPGLTSSTDKPKFIGEHSNHLLLGYPGGSVLYSGTGLPLSFLSSDGSGEIALGSELTAIVSRTRTATIIAARNKMGYLTGNDSTDFAFEYISEESGAVTDTMQVIGDVKYLDDIGIRGLQTTDAFGDWNIGTDTELIEPLIAAKRGAGITVVGAMRVRAKNQYRIFYGDKTVIVIYYGRQRPECMTMTMDFTPTCLFSGELPNGDEILLAGSSTGMVYRLDVGTSADGEEIEAYVMLPFTHQGAPNVVKRYHRAVLSMANGGPETSLIYNSNYDYGTDDQVQGDDAELSFPGAGGFWDVSNWDEFYWDSSIQFDKYAELNGVGKNISFAIASTSTTTEPHTLTGLALNFSARRKLR